MFVASFGERGLPWVDQIGEKGKLNSTEPAYSLTETADVRRKGGGE